MLLKPKWNQCIHTRFINRWKISSLGFMWDGIINICKRVTEFHSKLQWSNLRLHDLVIKHRSPKDHKYKMIHIVKFILPYFPRDWPGSSMWDSNQVMASSTPAFEVFIAAFLQCRELNPMSTSLETISSSAVKIVGSLVSAPAAQTIVKRLS